MKRWLLTVVCLYHLLLQVLLVKGLAPQHEHGRVRVRTSLSRQKIGRYNSSSNNNHLTNQLSLKTNNDDDSDEKYFPGFRTRAGTKSKDDEIFIQESLDDNDLYAQLPQSSKTSIVRSFAKVDQLREGHVLFRQGDRSDYVYLIEDGQCRAEVDGRAVPQFYGTLGSKYFVGDSGSLFDRPRAATVITASRVTLFRIDASRFKDLVEQHVDLILLQEIDNAINEVEGTKALYSGKVILPYKPERFWIWRQTKGTLMSISSKTTLVMMLVSLLFSLSVKLELQHWVWPLDWNQLGPETDTRLVKDLGILKEIWKYILNLTTFILTFFLNQAYSFWRKVYNLARELQDGLHDYHLLLATNVERNENGTLTKEAEILLDDIGQYSRLYHAFVWASLAKRYKSLTSTPHGLQRMKTRGLMTAKQLEILQDIDVPPDQLHFAPLEWMMIRTNLAIDQGILRDDEVKRQLLSDLRQLKNYQASIESELAGRMP
mmetsp:Transcript_26571/g.63276  ORF Transcript_26571/g.63276 Transcript_26571/m.63276 type:complete len:487 (-) Transcript_26571:1741-3201(-)